MTLPATVLLSMAEVLHLCKCCASFLFVFLPWIRGLVDNESTQLVGAMRRIERVGCVAFLPRDVSMVG